MSNITTITNENALSMWEKKEAVDQIKQIFAPKLNNMEFEVFVGLGKATHLNPFLREIWAVKYDERAAAQIFIGRDGYRKAAQSHPAYDYHYVEAIYSKDDFLVNNGKINHTFRMEDRGILLGAYCIVHRKNSSFPTYHIVDLKEYNTGQSVWKTKPATMIKKVAEAQALRAAFQDLFGGTYNEYEETRERFSDIEKTNNEASLQHLKKLKSLQGISNENAEIILDNMQTEYIEVYPEKEQSEYIQVEEDRNTENLSSDSANEIKKCTHEQVNIIEMLSFEKDFPGDRMRKALNHYGAAILNELTFIQAEELIAVLKKM